MPASGLCTCSLTCDAPGKKASGLPHTRLALNLIMACYCAYKPNIGHYNDMNSHIQGLARFVSDRTRRTCLPHHFNERASGTRFRMQGSKSSTIAPTSAHLSALSLACTPLRMSSFDLFLIVAQKLNQRVLGLCHISNLQEIFGRLRGRRWRYLAKLAKAICDDRQLLWASKALRNKARRLQRLHWMNTTFDSH